MIVDANETITLIGGAALSETRLSQAMVFGPRAVAADGGADTALAHGITPEAVIGDFDSISAAAKTLNYGQRPMPSGAGHDAQALAQVCPSGMIFVPSVGGLSHHPEERTSDEHLIKGANVLLHSLLRYLKHD